MHCGRGSQKVFHTQITVMHMHCGRRSQKVFHTQITVMHMHCGRGSQKVFHTEITVMLHCGRGSQKVFHTEITVMLHCGKGFSIGYTGPRLSREAHCLSSALANPVVVCQEKLQKEIQLGRIAGPFKCKPFSQLQCSPIGLVPKREPHTFRLIHHLSFPSGGVH